MGLTKNQISEIRKELVTSFNPLLFFDDDPDGLASFLLFYIENACNHNESP